MSFVQPSAQSTGRYSIGIGIAVVFHIVLIWALMNGLASKVAQVLNTPIETRIIEEVKPPPPPPKVIEMPPPPKFAPPPPAYVPPPEIQVQAPPPVAPTITTTNVEPPPAPVAIAPRATEAPPAPPAPAPAPPKAAPVKASVACSNYTTVMGEAAFPREAKRFGLTAGTAIVQFTLGLNGEIKDAHEVQSSHTAFGKASVALVNQYKCTGQGREVQVEVPFEYRSE